MLQETRIQVQGDGGEENPKIHTNVGWRRRSGGVGVTKMNTAWAGDTAITNKIRGETARH